MQDLLQELAAGDTVDPSFPDGLEHGASGSTVRAVGTQS
jgi:hypothetical protein